MFGHDDHFDMLKRMFEHDPPPPDLRIPGPKPGEIVIVIRYSETGDGRFKAEIASWPEMPPTVGRQRRMMAAISTAYHSIRQAIHIGAGDRVFANATDQEPPRTRWYRRKTVKP